MLSLIIVSLFLYLAFAVLAGIKTRGSSSIVGYFIADRNLNYFHLGLTIFASWFSTFGFLGSPGFFYKKGVAWFYVIGLFVMIVPFLSWFLGRHIWQIGRKNNYITPADLLCLGSKRLRILIAIVCVTALIPYALVQFIGIGKVLASSTNDFITYELGIVLAMFATAVYVSWGGIKAIVFTDIVQGILFLSVMLLASAIGIYYSGSLSEIVLKKPELFAMDTAKLGDSFSLMLMWSCGYIVLPHIMQRHYMAKSAKSLSKSIVLFSTMSLVMLSMMAIIGLTSISIFSDISDSDKLVPLLISTYLPSATFILILATFAAGMSTIDSQVLSATSIILIDLLKPLGIIKKEDNAFLSRLIALALIIFLGLLAIFPASNSLLIPLASKGIAIALTLFVPLVYVLKSRVVSSRIVELILYVGLLVLILCEILSYKYSPIFVILSQVLILTCFTRNQKDHL